MESHDLTKGWHLTDDGVDVIIEGPGNLEIVLRDFDARQLAHKEGLEAEVIGTMRQLSWFYPLGRGMPGDIEQSWVELMSTWEPSMPDHPTQHTLHVGNHLLWQLPESTGEKLQAWFARTEEQRPA